MKERAEEDMGSDGVRKATRAAPWLFCPGIEHLICFSLTASV